MKSAGQVARQNARLAGSSPPSRGRPCRPCRCCGEDICGWRRRDDGRLEPLGLDGLLHACDSKKFRNWAARERRRQMKGRLLAQRQLVAAHLHENERTSAPPTAPTTPAPSSTPTQRQRSLSATEEAT